MGRSAADIRGWIVGEIARNMNIDRSAIDAAAPLYSLGADSLAAITMTGELSAWLNRDLPATLMWDYESIDAIANALADPEAPAVQTTITFQPLGSCPPVFFFPGVGGHPVSFAAMSTHLAPNHPCIGLYVPGVKGEQEPHTTVEDIAAAMLKTVRQIQPAGPYQFAGYSFGGLLAYEAAQQLAAAGETVSMLAIYDTFTPNSRTLRPRWQRIALRAYLLATKRGGRRQYLRELLNRPWSSIESKFVEGEGAVEAREKDATDVAPANRQAAALYKPKPYPGAVLVFRAKERPTDTIFYKFDPSNGWGALTQGRVRVVDLAGNHANILSAKNAPASADSLKPYLSR